ncbi:hypothetical protein EVAR_59330_1 [Eumeta japonica]|uniref:Uncharacterized protein n=1 Tax=Eumeta variegata TaxID=151549 RepID=A0A4C1YT30_EUMVA|nr:hypothetical protein EVAR_59330_1 [Eumeta japonica]
MKRVSERRAIKETSSCPQSSRSHNYHAVLASIDSHLPSDTRNRQLRNKTFELSNVPGNADRGRCATAADFKRRPRAFAVLARRWEYLIIEF